MIKDLKTEWPDLYDLIQDVDLLETLWEQENQEPSDLRNAAFLQEDLPVRF